MSDMASRVKTLTHLQNECSTALRSYMEILQEGCVLLGKLNKAPIPEKERNEIFSHRREELRAHTRYTKARTQLWDFLTNSKNHESH
jgi:hypothetical protein